MEYQVKTQSRTLTETFIEILQVYWKVSQKLKIHTVCGKVPVRTDRQLLEVSCTSATPLSAIPGVQVDFLAVQHWWFNNSTLGQHLFQHFYSITQYFVRQVLNC